MNNIEPGQFKFEHPREENDFQRFIRSGLPSRFHSLRALFSMIWCWGYTVGKAEQTNEEAQDNELAKELVGV